VVLLHGFGGTHRAWDGVRARLNRERYLPLALDLPGHGEAADAPHPISFAGCVAHVLARAPERFTLCGYSMGGRVALQVALAAPQRIARLVLIACRPGIEDERERAQRRRADDALARELQTGSFEQFVQRWRSQELFADEPPEVARLAEEDQLRNRPHALAAVLRGIGVGQMEPLWQRLGELTMPVTVVVGSRDRRFQDIGRRMVARLPHATLELIEGGHGLPLENPAAVAAVLEGAPSAR
jgi:2-succinyl-6-hydroxy-2,4-cyclohexadiene-1-carboxylate synthase